MNAAGSGSGRLQSVPPPPVAPVPLPARAAKRCSFSRSAATGQPVRPAAKPKQVIVAAAAARARRTAFDKLELIDNVERREAGTLASTFDGPSTESVSNVAGVTRTQSRAARPNRPSDRPLDPR